jgi:hypothetical protein
MREKRTSELVGLMISCVVEIVLVNTVPLWSRFTHGVILETWRDILWAANISIIVRFCGYVALAIRRPARLYSALQAVNAAASMLSMVVFLVVFPMDFRAISLGWVNTALRVLTIFALVMGAITVAVNASQAARGTGYSAASSPPRSRTRPPRSR